MIRYRWTSSWRTRAAAGIVFGAAVLAVVPGRGLDAQTFRGAVDLIALEVQISDKNGKLIDALDAKSFEVSLDGKQRRVVSADLVRVDGPNRTAGEGALITGLSPRP